MHLGEFLVQFRGFSARAKARSARASVPAARKLSDLSDADILSLFDSMRAEVKEPSHNVLGSPIGKDRLVGALHRCYGAGFAGRAWYRAIKTEINAAPAAVEAAVVETSWVGEFSPSTSD
jgi:hypothetical protein